MENILICFEICQAEPILIEWTRHSHRPNVMFSFGTAPSERGFLLCNYNRCCKLPKPTVF